MATYSVVYSDTTDDGVDFKYRPPADALLEEARLAGQFARLIYWVDGVPTEIARVNAHVGAVDRIPALPDEVPDTTVFTEGAVRQITINAYERNPAARQRCVDHHGSTCAICGFNFGRFYGPLVEGLIHVHHLRPLSEIREQYQVDPIADLRPVCPNCHAVLHSRMPAYAIDEVRGLLRGETTK